MRPLIAVDICNTLADVIKVLEGALGPRPDASRYDVPGATEEFFRRNPWVFAQAPVILGARAGVEMLAAAGDIIYLTARPECSKSVTREWLLKHGFPGAPIITTTKKAVVARQLNVHLAVDDAPHEIDTLSRVCPVLVHAKPYNIGYPGRFTWDNENLLAAAIDLLTAPTRERLRVIS